MTKNSIVIARDGIDHEVESDLTREQLAAILRQFDGTRTIAQIETLGPGITSRDAVELIETLDEAGLVDDAAPTAFRTGIDVILELEDLFEELCAATVFQNEFWRACLAVEKPGDLPMKLATGMVVENWQFLFRESYFDAPVLSYVPNTSVRLLVNQFFAEEYGHDEILLRALVFAGLSRDDLHDSIPLPETMGLCNALAYWSHCDPLFFLATVGVLEGQGMKSDSFLDACERSGLPQEFVTPLRLHSNINLGAEHGNLSRSIFRQVPAVDSQSVARFRRQARVFVELYDSFYGAIWRYYTSDRPLLRRVSEL